MTEQNKAQDKKTDKVIAYLKIIALCMTILIMGLSAFMMYNTMVLQKDVMETMAETMEEVSSSIDDASYEVVE